MKRQFKVAAITSAAALLALGASLTSMAAVKGTWVMEDGEWYCYDSDGEVIENEFCLSNGKEYYVGDDGTLVCSDWVEDDGDYYYVNSAGQKVKNEWRYTTLYDDDDDDEQWFYFQSNGKRAEDKKLVINGNTYFFNADGEMLTGWIQENGDTFDEATTDDVKNTTTYYCDEDGARMSKAWVYTYAPSVDLDDIDSEDEEHWYWIKSSGKPATGKTSSINGETYFFDEEGKMLTGWIAALTASNADKVVTYYAEIWENDEDLDGYFDTELSAYAENEVYFAREDGHMKKNGWVCEYNNMDFGADDSDNDQYWFYINSTGKVYIPDGKDAFSADRYDFDDAEEGSWAEAFSKNNYKTYDGGLKVTAKKINSKTYWFDQNGQMMSDFVMDNTTGLMYYFGGWNDGVRKDGSQSIADDNGETYRFYFATDDDAADGYYNAAGINGAKNGKLYENGMLVKATEDKYETKTVTVSYSDGNETVTKEATFIVNKSGTIQSSAKEYEEDDDVLVDASNATFYGDGENEGVDALKNSVTSWN